MPVSLSSTSKSLPSLIHSRKNARLTFRLSSNSSRFLLCALLVATFCLVQNDITFKKAVESHPRLSLYLGGNKCRWQPPNYEDPPLNIKFHKTLVAGFPSGDKRLVFLQMEALTGLTAKDEWKFEDGGYTNHPFIKTNYPTHEGKLLDFVVVLLLFLLSQIAIDIVICQDNRHTTYIYVH